ncbi:MAG TPA: hypothetical protein ACHBX0_09210 [Arsenophonus sp.]
MGYVNVELPKGVWYVKFPTKFPVTCVVANATQTWTNTTSLSDTRIGSVLDIKSIAFSLIAESDTDVRYKAILRWMAIGW